MPTKRIAAAALLVSAPLASAGTAKIVNNCPFEIFVTPSQHGADKEIECYQPGQSYSAPISGEAVDLKVMTKRAFCFNDCVQLEYSVAGPDLFYDLSNINAKGMDGFVEYGISVENSDPNAPQVDCPPGKDKCKKGVYNEWWQNEATFCSKKDADLTMHLCTQHRDSPSENTAKAPPPPPKKEPPVVKPPPVKPVVKEEKKEEKAAPPPYVPPPTPPNVHKANLIGTNKDGSLDLNAKVVMVTDIVTETVFVKRAEATAAPMERRHLHRHARAHGHTA